MNNQPNNDLKSKLLADFRTSEERMNGASKSALHQIRREALNQFDRLGFPTVKHEEWKYTNVNSLIKEVFEFNASSELTVEDLAQLESSRLDGNVLYFVNGQYQPHLSKIVSPASQLTITTLAEAVKTTPDLLHQYFAKYADFQDNAFTALNTAFAQDGVVINVPANTTVEASTILRFVSDARHLNVASQPRNLFIVNTNAEIKIAESFRTLGDQASFTNVVTEIVVAEDARVEYYKIQNESDMAYHIGTTQVHQKDRSHFYSATVTLDGGFIRNNLNIALDGSECEAHMYGLYFPNGRQHIDNHTLVDHRKPNSHSNELYKGILEDRSTGVFNGKIFVREDAQKTNAYQSCKNVVLSNDATMNTKPQLEIFADDVKCSHGTTTGKLNEEALFYLRSRGIPKVEAQSLLMYAFAEDVIKKIKIDTLREQLERRIQAKLAR
ncbi:Fe-S cluster assembly protein SufD [Larkinella rosea]|uniref:Fe-S cluster assembly protein SufD n=1 Tax=Larkinella rosea TaxID=2025312 RepID=A0A3P1BMR4_9BACT|nr:Fe-S cluster assembly protein SufD [Larkinella rosea]RRB02193.1 Fe-S cluster assembly protein SufD [Larkinella rosea]